MSKNKQSTTNDTSNSSPIVNPEQEKIKTLATIKESYLNGLKYYQDNNLELAEQGLVKAMKPVLSKPSMQNLYVGIEDCKEVMLDAMYHLGKIYLVSNQYLDHYSKAAAIFQYCAEFAKKYNINPAIDFLEKAYNVEEQFFSSIGRTNTLSTSPEQINEYKQKLKQIRLNIEEKLKLINELTIEHIAGRAKAVEALYKDCTSFFVNNNSDKADRSKNPGLLQKLLHNCFEQLGPIPQGCEYSVIGLGSLAGGKMTPWSDLEFAIFINEDIEEYKEYFRNVTKLLHIKVINFGETLLRSIGIEALNNFRTANEIDDWFWDEVLPKGFCFDGAISLACKVPLGRQGGYKEINKVKSENDIEEKVIIDKPDYELILTPKQLAVFQLETKVNEDSDKSIQQKQESWFKSDMHLVQTLRTVRLINGSQDLLDDYRKELKNIESEQIIKSRALEKLQEDLSNFSLKLGDKEEGKLLDVKNNIFRIADRIIEDLANYYDITADKGQAGLTAWQIIDKMENVGILSKEGACHLKEAISIATELRLATYSHNEGQKEGLSTYIPTVEHLSDRQKKQLLEETFHIKSTSILHHFYYVMLKLQDVAKGFGNQKYYKQTENMLKNDGLLDDGNYIKGLVHARFLEYDKAIKHLEAAREYNPQDLVVLSNLSFLYSKTGIIEKAVELGKTISNLLADEHKDNTNHPDIATSYDRLGVAYSYKGSYEIAIEYYHKALEIRFKVYEHSPNHPDIAASCNNLGNTYSEKGDYEKAIIYHERALNIGLKAYEQSPNHPDIAASYNNIGGVYNNKGSYEIAIKYHQEALDIWLKAHEHNPNHPDIASSYDNLGNSYCDKGDYESGIKYHEQALKIRLKVYEHSPNHPDIANSYGNLGTAYSDKGDYETAITYYKQALKIRLKVYEHSPNHPNIAYNYNNLGNAHNHKGDYESGIKYHEQALKIRLKVYEHSPNHPDIASSYNNLGAAYGHKGDYEAAMSYYNQALKISLKAYEHSPNHPDIANSYDNLGTAYSDKGCYEIAIKYHKQALKIRLKAYEHSPNHPDIASSYNNLGNACYNKGDYENAITYYIQALEVNLKAYEHSPNHPNIASSYYNLGATYFTKGEYEQACFCLDKSLNIFAMYQNQLNIAKSKMLYHSSLVQLGNIALLKDNVGEAQKYYEQIDAKYKDIDFYSIEFFQLQLTQLEIAYGNKALVAVINCQLVLTKVDPGLHYGNHYHNLACFYVCKGDILAANEAFTKALNYPMEKGSLYAEYAQFLILNKSDLDVNQREISGYLYAAIYSNDSNMLQYGKIEKDSICNILKGIIEQKNNTIQVSPKILAYYLLTKNPQYIGKIDIIDNVTQLNNVNNIDALFEVFCKICESLQDEVAFRLLADTYRNTNHQELAIKYENYAALLAKVNDIITDKVKSVISDNKLEITTIQDLANNLQQAGLLAVQEGRLDDAMKLYSNILVIKARILIEEQEQIKLAIDNLATICLLSNDVKKFLSLKLQFSVQLNEELIKLSGKDINEVLEIEAQLSKPLNAYIIQQNLHATIEEASTQEEETQDKPLKNTKKLNQESANQKFEIKVPTANESTEKEELKLATNMSFQNNPQATKADLHILTGEIPPDLHDLI